MFLIAYVGTVILVTLFVMGVAAMLAKKKGKNPLKWAGLSFLALFVFMFWDYYPTQWAHQYYCEKEAGFWVYKTVEQWKAENPGVMEGLSSYRVWPPKNVHVGDMENYESTSFVNPRFNAVVKKNGPFLFNRWRWEQSIVDRKTNEVLARSVDFSTGNGYLGSAVLPLKFWLQHDECTEGKNNGIKLGQFSVQFNGVEK